MLAKTAKILRSVKGALESTSGEAAPPAPAELSEPDPAHEQMQGPALDEVQEVAHDQVQDLPLTTGHSDSQDQDEDQPT